MIEGNNPYKGLSCSEYLLSIHCMLSLIRYVILSKLPPFSESQIYFVQNKNDSEDHFEITFAIARLFL